MRQEQIHTVQVREGNSQCGSQGLDSSLNMVKEAILKDELRGPEL